MVAALAGTGCARPGGWYRADKAPTAPNAYDERFEPIEIASDGGCETVQLKPESPTGPIIVLVPGIGGDGDEMHQAVPALMALQPAALFMFRYSPWAHLGELADRLAGGLSRLAACRPPGASPILVLSHSAGGVLSGFAVSQVQPPAAYDGPWLTLLTVASPLAGTSGIKLGDGVVPQQVRIFGLMGLRIPGYPASAPGVRVVHLRSSAQSDGYMKPSGTHVPNDPSVGVPGAAQLDLPVELDHPGALVYVAKRIADGTWTQWLTAPAPARP